MIVYSATKERFQQDVMSNDIGNIIYSAHKGATDRGMAVEPQGWIKCPPGVKPDHNMFAAKVAGRSMESKLEDGDYCVFHANVVGSRNNKLVLVQHSSISDPDTGGSYTVIPNSAGITREAGGPLDEHSSRCGTGIAWRAKRYAPPFWPRNHG